MNSEPEMTADEARELLNEQLLNRYMEKLNGNVHVAINEAMKLAREELRQEYEQALRQECRRLYEEDT